MTIDWVEQCVRLHEPPAPIVEAVGLLSDSTLNAVVIDARLPVNVPPTPERYAALADAKVELHDVPNMIVAELLGCSCGVSNVRGGRIICDAMPTSQFKEKNDTAFGSELAFDFHADVANNPVHRPDYFALQFLRNTEQALTFVTAPRLDALSKYLALLAEPVYRIFREHKGDTANSVYGIPVIGIGATYRPRFNYYG